MRIIAIEEALNYHQLMKVRADMTKRENVPDMINKEFFLGEVVPKLAAPLESVRIPEMDQTGITMQILSSGSPGVQGCQSANEAIPLAREMNDIMYDVMRKFPERFGGFCSLPTQDPVAAAKELERCMKLGFNGAMVQGRTEGKYLDDPIYEPLWEAAESLGAPISLHVMDTNVDHIKILEGCYSLLGPTWSWNFESATHVLRILMNGIFERYPKVQVICGHMGEGLPYYLGRIDEGFISFSGSTEGKLSRLPSTYFKTNIHITTSGKYHPAAMRCAIDSMGIERILFACDYPFVSMEESLELIEKCNLTENEKEHIFHLNAEKLLKIEEI